MYNVVYRDNRNFLCNNDRDTIYLCKPSGNRADVHSHTKNGSDPDGDGLHPLPLLSPAAPVLALPSCGPSGTVTRPTRVILRETVTGLRVTMDLSGPTPG